jgi:hypothetical protein
VAETLHHQEEPAIECKIQVRLQICSEGRHFQIPAFLAQNDVHLPSVCGSVHFAFVHATAAIQLCASWHIGDPQLYRHVYFHFDHHSVGNIARETALADIHLADRIAAVIHDLLQLQEFPKLLWPETRTHHPEIHHPEFPGDDTLCHIVGSFCDQFIIEYLNISDYGSR